jgi:hypothetical protein
MINQPHFAAGHTICRLWSYQQWPADLLDVPYFRHTWRQLVLGDFGVVIWRSHVLGILGQEFWNSWSHRGIFFVCSDRHNHSICAGWLGFFRRRIFRNGSERRISYEGRRPLCCSVVFAEARHCESFTLSRESMKSAVD